MFKAKRSLVVSSLLVTVGVVYVGFGHPSPMGVPQPNLYGNQEERRSGGQEDRRGDRHARPDFSRQYGSQQYSRPRRPSESARPSLGRSNDAREKQNEPDVSANQSSEKEAVSSPHSESRERGRPGPQAGQRPGGSSWPPARPASSTSAPIWHLAPVPSQLAGEPGILMPEPIRGQLKLNATQHRELDQIQQELEERLQEVLTPEQFAKLEALREEFLDQELGRRE